jgi:ribosomal protein S2
MISTVRKNHWKKIIDKLVMENCLILGHHPKLTNKKFIKYIFGTRHSLEIFKLYELRYLLLKIYPVIYSLFNPVRFLQDNEISGIKSKNVILEASKKKKKDLYLKVKKHVNYRTKYNYFNLIDPEKNTPPQILFASVTPEYAHILEAAAKVCQMPWHDNRWLSGSITAAVSYLYEEEEWNFDVNTQIQNLVRNKYSSNKENFEQTKEKARFNAASRWPSLIIIPDVINNSMIIKETKKVGMPVIGLVNSACTFVIDYPIFTQDTSIYNVHFFCHFIAALIAKEMVQIQHKLFVQKKIGFLIKGNMKWKREIIAIKKKPILFRLKLPKQKLLRASFKNKIGQIVENKALVIIWRLFSFLEKQKKKQRFIYGLKKNKISFIFSLLAKRFYFFLLFNYFLNEKNNTENKLIPIFFSRQKIKSFQKNVKLLKKSFFWSFKQQKKVQTKLQPDFLVFQKWLKIQWINAGRLRYNNQSMSYYWKPLALIVSTDYIRLIKKAFRRRWVRDVFYNNKRPLNAYDRYKRWYWKKKRNKRVNFLENVQNKFKLSTKMLNVISLNEIRFQKKKKFN